MYYYFISLICVLHSTYVIAAPTPKLKWSATELVKMYDACILDFIKSKHTKKIENHDAIIEKYKNVCYARDEKLLYNMPDLKNSYDLELQKSSRGTIEARKYLENLK